MNERSVWNNMVGTNYGESFNIKIVSDPEVTRRCTLQKEDSSKFKTLLGKGLTIGGILLALGGAAVGMAHITNAQEQSRIENTQVVQIVNLPDGATLNVTENPSYSYLLSNFILTLPTSSAPTSIIHICAMPTPYVV